MTEKTHMRFISILMVLVAGLGLAHLALAHGGAHSAQAEAELDAQAEVTTQDRSTNSDTDGRAQNHNSSRSNETEGASDGGDLDGDGYADIEVGARDPDDDGDGIPDVESNAAGSQGANASAEARGIDKSTPKLYQGVHVGGSLCASSEDCDDEDGDMRPGEMHKLRVQVSGSEVRGWDPEVKEQIQTRLQTISEINDANDFGISVAQAAIANENVADIATDDEETQVRFNTTMRFFGFIPTQVQAVARASADGDVKVDYPWYSFLARKSDASVFTQMAADIRAMHDVMISVEEEGAPVNRREDTEDSTE